MAARQSHSYSYNYHARASRRYSSISFPYWRHAAQQALQDSTTLSHPYPHSAAGPTLRLPNSHTHGTASSSTAMSSHCTPSPQAPSAITSSSSSARRRQQPPATHAPGNRLAHFPRGLFHPDPLDCTSTHFGPNNTPMALLLPNTTTTTAFSNAATSMHNTSHQPSHTYSRPHSPSFNTRRRAGAPPALTPARVRSCDRSLARRQLLTARLNFLWPHAPLDPLMIFILSTNMSRHRPPALSLSFPWSTFHIHLRMTAIPNEASTKLFHHAPRQKNRLRLWLTTFLARHQVPFNQNTCLIFS